MKQLLSLIGILGVATLWTGCESSGKHPDTTDEGTWVKLFDDKNFDESDDWTVIDGPGTFTSMQGLPDTERDWDNSIESLQVGPDVKLTVYSKPGFRGRKREFGPNSAIANLDEFDFDNQIGSMKVEIVRTVEVEVK
jgi:hypothetical protein